jgi:hypothetical protein
MNVELHATTATEYTEWYRAGGSYEKLEAAAIEHITKEQAQHIDHLVALHQDLS